MSKLRYIILLTFCLLTTFGWAQRRYSASENHEYDIGKQKGFSRKDVEEKTDVLFGLHASQYSGVHHLMGFSLEGSWSSFVNTMPRTTMLPNGFGSGLHLLYEYQYSGFILQTGLGVTYQRMYNNIADTTIYHEHMKDTWRSDKPEDFTLKHDFYDRQDMAQQIYGQIPLYFGHYIFGSYGIGYFLGGVQVGYALWGNTIQTLTGTSTGKYEKYIGIWEEMDNHGFRKDVPIESKGQQLKLKFDLQAHLEIGYEYNTRQTAKDYRVRPSDRMDGRIRFAAFADFSILDICPNTDLAFYYTPEETIFDFSTYQMNHVFSTPDAKDYWLRNLFVGVRITFLFGFQPAERCILCDPWRH
jgi:hypothetical protein